VFDNQEWFDYLHENSKERSIFTYLQGLQEIISGIKPRSMTEERRLSIAKQHLREARRSARQMQNELQILEERLTILEENKNEDS
tara:strand:+ start:163 stop:417 length:255 start_codon:yes stop_codon:yes gene_type:complete